MIAGMIERLRTLPELKLVGGSAAFQQAAENSPTVTPAAFIYPLGDEPAGGEVANMVLQRVVTSVAVMIVVRNVSDSQGMAAGQDMDLLRKAVKELLLGWEPAPEHDPLERGPGNLMLFKNGYMWWQDIYVTAFYDRSIL